MGWHRSREPRTLHRGANSMMISRIVPWAAVVSLLTVAPVLADGNRGDDRVVVVTHLDIIPTFTANAQPIIEQFAVDSRNDPGVELFIVVSWTPTTNHFQLIRSEEHTSELQSPCNLVCR